MDTLLDAGENLEFYGSRLDHEYAEIIPDDMWLVKRFEQHLKANPSEYAPLRAKDMA